MKPKKIEFITSDTPFHAPYTHRILLLCEEKNIPYQLTSISLQDKPQWFINIASKGEVPVMRTNDKLISGSFDIASYLDTLTDCRFINSEENANFFSILKLINDFGHEITTFLRERKNTIPDLIKLNKYMAKLEKLFHDQYLIGKKASYLDLALIPHILQIDALESLAFPFCMLIKYQKLFSWYRLMMTRKSVILTSRDYSMLFIEHLKHRGLFAQFEESPYIHFTN